MASSLTVDGDQSAEELRPPPRPIAPRRRKLRERISLGHLFMIASALLAFVLVVSLLQDRAATTTILVANTEILPGTTITPAMVSEIEIPADSELVGLVATLDTISGGTVSAGQRVAAGDPLTVTALTPASSASALRVMSIPIDQVDAVGGDLTAGDRVDVISVEAGSATFVAVDLEVLDTPAGESRTGALGSSALTRYFVTVAVDDQTALAIALAQDRGMVSVIRSTGATAVAEDQRVLTAPGTGAGTAGSDTLGSTLGSDDESGEAGTGESTPGEGEDSGGANG